MAWHEGGAQTTNIIWQAKINGKISIQQHTTVLNRVKETAKFKTEDFFRMVLGTALSSNQVLALNINVQGSTTNLFLSVYNKVTRQNIIRITTNEVTVLLEDNKQYSSSMTGALIDHSSKAGTVGGVRGELVIAGRGKESHGYPITQNAKIGGYLIDPFPSDIGGTTGLILRATLKTSGKPLRVEPVFVPGSP
jgi:hypothetical protein